MGRWFGSGAGVLPAHHGAPEVPIPQRSLLLFPAAGKGEDHQHQVLADALQVALDGVPHGLVQGADRVRLWRRAGGLGGAAAAAKVLEGGGGGGRSGGVQVIGLEELQSTSPGT